jgi:transposase
LVAHLSTAELGQRYRAARQPIERSHLQIVWLLSQGRSERDVAAISGYGRRWIGVIVHRYNEQGPWACPAFVDTSDRLKGLEVTMSEDTIRRRSFPEAFKREAVAAICGGRSVSQVAAELGLADRLVRSWLRWAEDHPAEASGTPAPTPSRAQAAPMRRVGASPADQAAEIARLRKELERARMERDILKRAALIFGQATDRR